MDELVEWLRGQLADDEKAAKAATPGPWQAEAHHHRRTGEVVSAEVHPVAEQEGNGDGGVSTPEDATHIARHDPAAVIADIEAKKAVLDATVGEVGRLGDLGPLANSMAEDVVRALARAYRHRSGWKSSWE